MNNKDHYDPIIMDNLIGNQNIITPLLDVSSPVKITLVTE